jgi:hypothetical protein
MFQIVNVRLDNAVWVNPEDGKPYLFGTGQEAAAFCSRQNELWDFAGSGVKLQPRRIADDGSWQERERGRLASGEYTAVPWATLSWFARAETALHFAHVSTVDGAKIAYTEDAVKGQAYRQTRIKPGKYLARFYADVLSTEEIARLSAEFSKTYEDNVLRFATTADDWERVYVDGPSSCMSKSASSYDSPCHPVRVYAGPDLQLAYLERNGDVTARAIVWPEKKIYSRIYGDQVRLADMLEDAGFSEGSLQGARIVRKAYRDGFVLPYVDYIDGVSDNGTYLVLDGGDIACDQTNGLSGDTGRTCECCGSNVDEDEGTFDRDSNFYCDDCYRDRYSYCEYYEEDMPNDGFQEVIVRVRSYGPVTQWWCEDAIDNHAFICDNDGKLYHDDMKVLMANGDAWSTVAFEEYGATCEATDECYPADETVQLEDGTTWSKEHFAEHGIEIDGKLYDKDDAPSPDEEDEEDDATTETTITETDSTEVAA